jgi:hypothetical protein
MASSSDYGERMGAGKLMRLARVRLFPLEKDRARSRRYYQRNTEAWKATNMERHH